MLLLRHPHLVRTKVARIDSLILTASLPASFRTILMQITSIRLNLLEQRKHEAEQKKDQGLAAQRRRMINIIAAEILVGIVTAGFLFSVERVIAFAVAVAAVVAVLWTWHQQTSSREALTAKYDQDIASCQQRQTQFQPETQCFVGKIWWALQLAWQPDHSTILLDLARSAVAAPVSLVLEPTQEAKRHPLADGTTDQVEEFTGLLTGLDQLTADAKGWAVTSAPLPVVSKDVPIAENLARETAALLTSQPVQPAAADLWILNSDGSLVSLEAGLCKQIAAWQKCLQNAGGWSAHFKGLSTQVQKTRERALEAFRQNSEGWLIADAGRTAPRSVWANLSTQRPDIKGLLEHLKTEQEQLARRLEGDIEHEQRESSSPI